MGAYSNSGGRGAAGLLLSTVLLAFSAPSSAGSGVNVVISGNTVTATVDLPGISGSELILTFDDPANLLPANLGISASLLSLPDLALQARLPDLNLTSVPLAFPVLISVEPPAVGGLAFDNSVQVELHTHALPYGVGSPLRLFKAPLGGSFRDITDEVAPGSVRTRGRTGGFSEFLVIVDTRPLLGIATQKLDDLDVYLALAGGITSPIRNELQGSLSAARASLQLGCYEAALGHIGTFQQRVDGYAGNGILNRWSAILLAAPNDAGELYGRASSLRFSLLRLRMDSVFGGGFQSGEAACNSP